jgi:taurine dioxygenase
MMNIRLAGEHIGVEVTGVDAKTMSDADFGKIYQAWIDHNVMVVKGQDLTIPEFLTYSRRFGIVNPHPSKSTRHPDYPDITLLGTNKFDTNGQLNQAIYRRGAEGWHTDGAYDEVPFKATQLYAIAIPDTGGDTLFASGYAAYEALPQQLKQRLDGVVGGFTYGGRKSNQALLNPEDRDWKPMLHPIVRTHRESGRKSLYFDPGKIVFVKDMEESASNALIEELTDYMIQPAGQYRHKWSVGDIVIWDNRCSYHKAAGDYPPEQDRIHWRVSIKDWDEAGKMAAE